MQTIQKKELGQLWPYFLLLILAVLFLGDVWFGGKTMLLRDFFFGDETTRLYIGKAILHGKIPTWYPLTQCGIPFAASPYTASFYPLNWLYALPSVEWAICLSWTLHFALSAVGCFLLARAWKLEIAPALFAAISFSFGTYCVAWVEFGHGFYCMTWVPFVMLFVGRLIDETAKAIPATGTNSEIRLGPIFLRNALSIVALAFVLTMQVTTSGEFFYYSSLLVAAYGAARWIWHRSWKVCGISMLWIGLAGLLALGLSSPQLFSTFELMSLSVRSGEVDTMAYMTSGHPRHWLTLLLPYLYGHPGYPASYWAPTIFEFASGTFYVGILPLIAAFFCWLKRDSASREMRYMAGFFALVIVAGLVMAAGNFTPVYAFLHHWLPGLGHLRFPIKFYFFSAFGLAMLGGLGFQALLTSSGKNGEKSRFLLWWAVAGIFGLFLLGYFISLFDSDFLLWLMAHPKTPSLEQMSAVLNDYAWAAGFTFAGLSLFAMLAFRRGSLPWISGGIVAVAFINMCAISRQAQPTGQAGFYSQLPTELAKHIEASPMYRVLSTYGTNQQYFYGETRPEIWAWAANAGATYHIQQLGFNTLTPGGLPLSRYMDFFSILTSAPQAISEKFADMLSMRYVIGGAPFDQILWGNASRDIRITKRPNCLPRAFIVPNWLVITGNETIYKTIASDSFNPHKTAIVEPLPNGINPPNSFSLISTASSGEVQSFADHGTSVMMDAEVKGRALLVLGDTFYPGWTATVDGVETPIFQTNFLFRGVFLEPGKHHIEFSYTPTHFILGFWIWAASVATCIGMLWLSRRSSTNALANRPVPAVS